MSTASRLAPRDNKQYDLFGAPQARDARPRPCASDTGRRFITGNAHEIVLGTTRLEDWLKQVGQRAPFIVTRLLEQQDWQGFERRYAGTGRAPYLPRQMMGLILYGVMQGVHSLRELERLARLDPGCMWVTGGITPDHANIGRFIVLHEDSLTQEFFESLTRAILKASGSSSARLAGDGTVIEAACSRYNLLKQEAVRDRVQAAEAALEHAPNDRVAQQARQRASQCQAIFGARLGARQDKGKGTGSLRISGTEPEAMVQRLKRGQGYGASYKPSVLANADRIVTALALDASSETRVIASMLDQSARVTGTQAEEVLLDAGYFDDEVIGATLARDVSLLCPQGQWPSGPKEGGLFHKSAFDYDELTDSYRCPAGQILLLEAKTRKTLTTREHRVYGASVCGDCHLRANCTKAAHGRRIKRHPEDEQREALRVVMQHPQARRIFSQRKAIVEPLFSGLRDQQGLNRFRRRGLAAVRREFALHVMAHNLSRAVALQGALLAVLWATLLVLGKFGLTLRARLLARLPRFNRKHSGCLMMRFATASEGRGFPLKSDEMSLLTRSPRVAMWQVQP